MLKAFCSLKTAAEHRVPGIANIVLITDIGIIGALFGGFGGFAAGALGAYAVFNYIFGLENVVKLAIFAVVAVFAVYLVTASDEPSPLKSLKDTKRGYIKRNIGSYFNHAAIMSARIDRARLSLLRSGKGSSYIDKEPGFKYMIEYCGKIAGRLEDIKNKYGK